MLRYRSVAIGPLAALVPIRGMAPRPRPPRRAATVALAASALAVLAAPPLVAQGAVPRDTVARRSARDSMRTRVLESVRVVERADDLTRWGGSATVLGRAQLDPARVWTVEEALRGAPGVHTRIEDGIGLRPHIGIRGLDPLRSRKVLLLQDGMPFVLAPYGDSDSYFMPPVDGVDRVEVVTGAGQVRFGPQTIGGVINFVSRPIPVAFTSDLRLQGGAPGLFTAQARAGGSRGSLGGDADVLHKRGELARDNTAAEITDVTLRGALTGARRSLLVRLNAHDERTRAPYSGLTEAEWAANPRLNPFVNDRFTTRRVALGTTFTQRVGDAATFTTRAYAYRIERENWRQSGNSAQRPNDASDPACASMANLLTTCGNEGRVRDYDVAGVEPVLRAPLRIAGLDAASDIEVGARLLVERQDRRQVNAATPTGRVPGPPGDRNAGLVEDNLRTGEAASVFVQPRLVAGPVTITPGLRYERVVIRRTNRLATPGNPDGVTGRTIVEQWIPGVSVAWSRGDALTLFAGAHRGFAPPRPEDVISNTTGGTVELDAELSWNSELGARGALGRTATWSATAFRMDFENQIIPASTAGGTGALFTNAGRTRHLGAEGALAFERPLRAGSPHRLVLRGTATWLPVARFEGERFAYVGARLPDVIGKVYPDPNAARARVPVRTTGNRLPYAPEWLASAAIGWAHASGSSLTLEAVHTGRQFGDAVNTPVLVPDGQQGPIPAVTVLHASAQWALGRTGTTLFVSARNLTYRLYLVDRSRGLMPGMGRVVFAGFRVGR